MSDLAGLARYNGLALGVRRGMGERHGERRFPGRPQPSGIELESWALYAPGDDLRHLDWSALGRLDTLLVRRFTAEREVCFHLLLDTSASMGVPAGDGKLAAARELGLALAYLALAGGDAVRVALLSDGAQARESRVLRHRARLDQAAAPLDEATAAGPLDLGTALAEQARRHPRPGAALIVSDFMLEPATLELGLVALRAQGYEIALLHVIGPGELEPERTFRQGLLRDVESGDTHPVRLTAALAARYRGLLAEHLAALAAVAERTRSTYARLVAGTPVHAFVTGELRRLGLVRRR